MRTEIPGWGDAVVRSSQANVEDGDEVRFGDWQIAREQKKDELYEMSFLL